MSRASQHCSCCPPRHLSLGLCKGKPRDRPAVCLAQPLLCWGTTGSHGGKRAGHLDALYKLGRVQWQGLEKKNVEFQTGTCKSNQTPRQGRGSAGSGSLLTLNPRSAAVHVFLLSCRCFLLVCWSEGGAGHLKGVRWGWGWMGTQTS